jgi:hypothetical protein
MDTLSSFIALMVTLSMATERVTEAIKGFPILSLFLAQDKKAGSWQEEARKAAIHIIAIAVGTGFAYAAQGPICSALKLAPQPHDAWGLLVLLGGLASGGSGIWNSTLDLVRTIKQQKESVLQQAQKAAGNA